MGTTTWKDLRLLVCSSVVPSGGQEPGVVGGSKPVHQLRHELFGGQAAESLVLRRDGDVKAPVGRRHELLGL